MKILDINNNDIMFSLNHPDVRKLTRICWIILERVAFSKSKDEIKREEHKKYVERHEGYDCANLKTYRETGLMGRGYRDFLDDYRVCIDAALLVGIRSVHYEIDKRMLEVRDRLYSNPQLIAKEERFIDIFYDMFYNVDMLIELLSIAFIAMNQTSDSTLGNNYSWKEFMYAFCDLLVNRYIKVLPTDNPIILEFVEKNKAVLDTISDMNGEVIVSKHFYYGLKFLNQIDYKVINYCRMFYPYDILVNEQHKQFGIDISHVPHCYILSGKICKACKRNVFPNLSDDEIQSQVQKLCFIE